MKTLSPEEEAALTILKAMPIPIIEAALLAKQALTCGKGKIKQAHLCIHLGEEALRQHRKSVTFRKAAETALEERQLRRKRTVWDFRYYTKRLIQRNAGLGHRLIRTLTARECEQYLKNAFPTPQQFRKARAIMSGVFSTACRHEWCPKNPVRQVETPPVTETRMPILTQREIREILKVAEEYDGGSCHAAVALMLYAGLRPHEVTRLQWEQIDLRHDAVVLLPRHTKTGGARRVPIRRPLKRILEQRRADKSDSVCPPRWLHKWATIHRLAGWNERKPWRADILRHTFASYHLQHFRDYNLLQFELGHRDASLLRTRYVDLSLVDNTADFWEEPFSE